MNSVRKRSQRVLVVLGYEPFYRMAVCAAKVVGIPKGVVWLSVGWHKDGWWSEDDPDVLGYDASCTPAEITAYYDGGIGASGLGKPAESAMSTPLPCFNGSYSSSTFRDLLSLHYAEGYPVGENLLSGDPYSEIEGNAPDAMCVWAYLVRHMLNLGYEMSDLSRPNGTTYAEEIRFIKEDISFAGVSGLVNWKGNDIPGVMAVNQVQGDTKSLVATVDLEGVLTFEPGAFLRWGDGSSAPGSAFLACDTGFLPNQDSECVPCAAGRYFDTALEDCVDCSKGYHNSFENQWGLVSCLACAEGTFGGVAALVECTNCSTGTYSEGKGATACDLCGVGLHAPETGAAVCDFCSQGKYSTEVGAQNCEECPKGLTTIERGERSNESCTCAPGTYFLGFDTGCFPCSEGFLCPGTMDEPLQDEGYFVRKNGAFDYSVFVCFLDSYCPARLPLGGCPAGRTALSCDLCAANHHPNSDGTCEECKASSMFFSIFLSVAIGAFVLSLFVAFTIRESTISKRSNLTVLCCVSIVVTSLQVLDAMITIPIEWIEPMITLKNILGVVSLDVDLLQPACIYKVNTALSQYLGSLLVFPMLAVVVLAIFQFIRWPFRLEVEPHCVWNSLGRVFLLGYLPLCLLAWSPFQCITNPGASPQTLSSYRSIECWSSDQHKGMVSLAVLAVLAFPVFLLSIVTYATFSFPRRVPKAGGIAWLKKFSFLFKRFHSKRHSFAVAHLLRSFFMALLPNLLPNEIEVQVMFMLLILAVYMALQASLWPWRTDTANYIDAIFTCGLILVMGCGGMLVDLDTSHSQVVVQVFMIITLSATFGGAFVWTLYYSQQAIFPPKRYALFLSHHKGGAAALARYIKEFCNQKISGRIFLDSDELNVLDHLFSIAAEDTRNFVMILTSQTLQRFWVAGEIASAYKYRSHMIGLACDGFTTPTDEFIGSLEDAWTHGQQAELSSMGVSVKDIQTAYKHMQKMDFIEFRRDMSFKEQDGALDEMLKRCSFLSATCGHMWPRNRLNKARSSVADRMVGQKTEDELCGSDWDMFITGNMLEMEALFTCRILHRMLQFETQRGVVVVNTARQLLDSGCSSGRRRQYVICVCTKGILEAETFPAILQACDYAVEMIPVASDPSFTFPGVDFYENLAQGKIFACDGPVAREIGLESVADLYKRLFSRISLSFTVSGNRSTQATEVKALSHHVPLLWLNDGTAERRQVEVKRKVSLIGETPKNSVMDLTSTLEPDEQDPDELEPDALEPAVLESDALEPAVLEPSYEADQRSETASGFLEDV